MPVIDIRKQLKKIVPVNNSNEVFDRLTKKKKKYKMYDIYDTLRDYDDEFSELDLYDPWED